MTYEERWDEIMQIDSGVACKQEFLRHLREVADEAMQVRFGMIPPPVDNEHVADGCEKFQQPEPRWIQCSERMPTEEDGIQVWVWWIGAKERWGNTPYLHHWSSVNAESHSHWQPTGLRRPDPPKG